MHELEIANAIEPLQLVRAKTVDVCVPAECEFVLEGTVYRDRRHAEGRFVDLTETQDIIRQEPVFVFRAITHRKDAFWHALLPGGLEHKLLMGMPREPTIYRKVNEVVRCLDVNVNPGGCSGCMPSSRSISARRMMGAKRSMPLSAGTPPASTFLS